MADLRDLALRRKLAAAEAIGDKALVKRLRARVGKAEAAQEEPDAEEQPEAAPEPEAAQEPAEAADEGDGLDNVSFASPAARKAAEDAGLSAESFKHKRKSSERGFTTADVDRLVGQG